MFTRFIERVNQGMSKNSSSKSKLRYEELREILGIKRNGLIILGRDKSNPAIDNAKRLEQTPDFYTGVFSCISMLIQNEDYQGDNTCVSLSGQSTYTLFSKDPTDKSKIELLVDDMIGIMIQWATLSPGSSMDIEEFLKNANYDDDGNLNDKSFLTQFRNHLNEKEKEGSEDSKLYADLVDVLFKIQKDSSNNYSLVCVSNIVNQNGNNKNDRWTIDPKDIRTLLKRDTNRKYYRSWAIVRTSSINEFVQGVSKFVEYLTQGQAINDEVIKIADIPICRHLRPLFTINLSSGAISTSKLLTRTLAGEIDKADARFESK